MCQQEKPVIRLDFGNKNNDPSYIADREKRIPGTLSLRMVPMKDRLAANHTFFYITDDGRVTCGKNYPYIKFDAEKWHNIVAIDAGPGRTVGLRSDGTVVAEGDDECDVSAWKNITAICTKDKVTFGLRQDGTVVATAADWDTSSLRNVTGIACGSALLLGLHADGTLTAIASKGRTLTFCGKLQTWRDLVAAAAGRFFVVGLHADGTVTAVGNSSYGACNVSSWRNIVSVRCSNSHTVGLRSDGTVVATGDNQYGQCDVSTWRNIVAIAASDFVTYGLRADGTVVSTQKGLQKKLEKTDSVTKASQGETVHSHIGAASAGQTQPGGLDSSDDSSPNPPGEAE